MWDIHLISLFAHIYVCDLTLLNVWYRLILRPAGAILRTVDHIFSIVVVTYNHLTQCFVCTTNVGFMLSFFLNGSHNFRCGIIFTWNDPTVCKHLSYVQFFPHLVGELKVFGLVVAEGIFGTRTVFIVLLFPKPCIVPPYDIRPRVIELLCQVTRHLSQKYGNTFHWWVKHIWSNLTLIYDRVLLICSWKIIYLASSKICSLATQLFYGNIWRPQAVDCKIGQSATFVHSFWPLLCELEKLVWCGTQSLSGEVGGNWKKIYCNECV